MKFVDRRISPDVSTSRAACDMLPLANPTVGQGRLEGRVSGCKTDNQRSEPCRFALRRSGQGLIYSHRRRINFRWTEACPVDAPSSYLLSVDLQPAADAHVGINGFPTRSLRHDHQLSRGALGVSLSGRLCLQRIPATADQRRSRNSALVGRSIAKLYRVPCGQTVLAS